MYTSLFKKIRFFVPLLLVFVATLSMTGCSDDTDTAGKMPGASFVNVIGNYNIVKFNGEVYGVPHGIPIDWHKDDLKKVPGMIVDTSAEKVEKTIKNLQDHDEKIAVAPAPEAALETVIGNYNIVNFNGKVYGVPHGIAIDWHKDDLPKVNGMIVGSSVTLVTLSVIGHQISEKLSKLTSAK